MKHFIPFGLGLALAAGLCPAADNGTPNPSRFETQAVRRGPLTPVVRAVGTLEPEEVVDVGARVAGTIQQFGTDPNKPIDYGSVVKAGTVLAQLDPRPYEAELDRARA